MVTHQVVIHAATGQSVEAENWLPSIPDPKTKRLD